VDAWTHATELYARAGVREACLTLQDAHGQCLAFLLWRAWTLSEGRAVDEATLRLAARLAAEWQAGVSGPLRAARRRLAAGFTGVDDAKSTALCAAVVDQEIAAERLLIEALALATRDGAHVGAIPALDALGAAARAFGAAAPDELLAKLVAGC
jgi:uncharacterized protein (TIGR02444 family)